MDRCNCFYLVSIRCALGFFLLLTVRVAEADPCVSLVNSSFEICTNAGYDTTTPFPSYITAAIKSDIAAEVIHAINLTRNCAVKGLAEAIECSSVVPKCNSLGRPILPCREVCAEFLKQCESHLDVFNLDYLISFCLVLPTNSSNCAPCMVPPNFTTNSSVPGPLDRGCQDVIIPVCKNLGLYDHTLSSVPAQKDLYTWMYDKNYTDNNLETEFPDFVQKRLDKYPKCQENIKKLFCGEHLPPCFPGESPRLYSLCEPLCDQIAFDCPEFFSHDLTAEEYCSTMAKGNSAHGFCQSNQWPESLSWFPYAESTRAPKITKRLPQTTPKALDDSAKGIKVWAIVVTVLLVVQIIAFFVLGVLYWRARLLSSPAYARADL